jgi:transposase-like protein
MSTMPALICPNPSCDGQKAAAHYLCRGCWYTLTRTARTALSRRDAQAALRRLELNRQLQDGVALHLIQITR